jgi:hypothetical protein
MFTLGIDSQPHRVMQYHGVREGPNESPEEDMLRHCTQALANEAIGERQVHPPLPHRCRMIPSAEDTPDASTR